MSYFIKAKALSAAAVLLAACISSKAVYAENNPSEPFLLEHRVSVSDAAVPEPLQSQILNASEAGGVTGSGYIYDMFNTDAEREFYNRLLRCGMEVHESDGTYEMMPYAKFSDLMDYETAKEVAWIFHYNHPEFFWMDSHYWISGNHSISFELFEDYQDGTARNNAKAEIEAVCDDYIANACSYTTEYQRAEYLFRQLHADIDYQEGDLDQSIASALLDKATVCAGYSKSYALLCNAVGVEAVTIVGYNHGWNAVKLSDKWYIADVTNGNFLYSQDEIRALDIELGARYTGTMTSSDGTTVELDFYMHDVAEQLFPEYYDNFPECSTTYTSGAGDVPATTTAATTTTTTTTTTTVTTTTTAIPTSPSGSYAKGDLNNDTLIELTDASMVLQVYAMNSASLVCSISDAALTAGDINENGRLDIDDASMILTYYAQNAAGLDASWDAII